MPELLYSHLPGDDNRGKLHHHIRRTQPPPLHTHTSCFILQPSVERSSEKSVRQLGADDYRPVRLVSPVSLFLLERQQ